MHLLYPVSPTSLEAARYNLKDAATYTITYFNSPTHATTGITGNGTTQYGSTTWNISTNGSLNNIGLTYSGTYSSGDHPMGAVDTGVAPASYLAIRNISNQRLIYAGETANAAIYASNARGVSTGIRDAVDNRIMYFNGTAGTANTGTDGAVLPNENLYVLCRNVNGSAASFFAGEVDFWAIHQGLTAGEAQDLSDAISTYNANVILGGR